MPIGLRLRDGAPDHIPYRHERRLRGVSEGGYHARRRRAPSPRAVAARRRRARGAMLLPQLRALHARSEATYGAPRLLHDLRKSGERHGQKRIAR